MNEQRRRLRQGCHSYTPCGRYGTTTLAKRYFSPLKPPAWRGKPAFSRRRYGQLTKE